MIKRFKRRILSGPRCDEMLRKLVTWMCWVVRARTLYLCVVQCENMSGRKPELLDDDSPTPTHGQQRRHDIDRGKRPNSSQLTLRQSESDSSSVPVYRHSGRRTTAAAGYLDKLYSGRLTADKCASFYQAPHPVSVSVICFDADFKHDRKNLIAT